jgi:hypothetical protein
VIDPVLTEQLSETLPVMLLNRKILAIGSLRPSWSFSARAIGSVITTRPSVPTSA